MRYATGGAEAVSAATLGDVDLILMDVRMPEVDGFEATRRIRALGDARGKVPILGLTAQAFSEQVMECLEAGMNGHLAEPYMPAALQEAVQEVADTELGSDGREETTDERPSVGCDARNTLPLRDQKASEFVSRYLTAPVLAGYLQAISTSCDAILHGLQDPDALAQASDAFADAVDSLAGCAGMLGFIRLNENAFAFERGLRFKADGMPELAQFLKSAISTPKEGITTPRTSKLHNAV